MRIKHLLPLTAAALIVAAAPAHAGYPAQAQPAAGVIEHRVIEVFDSTAPAGVPKQSRTEQFVARGRDRAVTYDASGTITSEVAKNGTDLRTWDLATNVLRVTDHGIAGANFIYGRAAEGQNADRLIAAGTYNVVGETAWNGRPALQLSVSVPDRPGHTLTHIVARDTRRHLETTEVNGAGEVTFSRKVVVDEDLPMNAANAAKLAMSSHPNATVKVSAARAKKAKKTRKVRR